LIWCWNNFKNSNVLFILKGFGWEVWSWRFTWAEENQKKHEENSFAHRIYFSIYIYKLDFKYFNLKSISVRKYNILSY
jgi:hypothetical protein